MHLKPDIVIAVVSIWGSVVDGLKDFFLAPSINDGVSMVFYIP